MGTVSQITSGCLSRPNMSTVIRNMVPNVAGTDISTAVDILEGAGLCIGETDGPANTPVIATDPPAGTIVFFGTCVRIITSEALAGS